MPSSKKSPSERAASSAPLLDNLMIVSRATLAVARETLNAFVEWLEDRSDWRHAADSSQAMRLGSGSSFNMDALAMLSTGW